ncbi:SMP-30/gluconolactonase/LRE family protein [Sphingobium nicotianae]|uniref:SMP-30/gluconolactonase/LRE family protein n=1 Tax=Sphingobium nicotianae TaxID=2782607 RepID=A0A9X1DDJ0_9SPHN|nr:SMP-30/gluconolactonase/LRE family protein [Sphingobium nicotianae]MBT2187894.1 SMP-30/gluconolactonase/LRE family protein [Sphingobium nicotianae]
MEFETVTDKLGFPEGPIACADGSVLVVEIAHKTLTRVRPDGSLEVVAELGGGPNGAAIGPDGACYVVNNGGAFDFPENWKEEGKLGLPKVYEGGSIQRVDLATGAATTLYDNCDGKPLNAPNDIVFDAQGGMWFTCFGYSDGENRRLGGVYYAKPDGSQITRWRSEQISPNGIALSADEKTLYWVDSMLQRAWKLDILSPGVVAPEVGHTAGEILVNLPGMQWFDSIALEASGRIAAATLFNGGITVVHPATGTYEHVPVPDPITTNICFGGPDMQTAWITGSASGSLFKCRWPRPGHRLNFQQI